MGDDHEPTSSEPFQGAGAPGAGHRAERLLTTPFVGLLVVQVTFGLSFSVFFLLPKFLAERGATATQIGVVMSAWGVAGLIVGPLVGTGVDRHGRRPFLLGGIGLMALAACGYMFVRGHGPLALGLRLAQGVAFALVYNAVMTLVADVVPARRLGQAMGLAGLGGLVTNAIAPVVAEAVARAFGWGAAFAGSAGMGLVALAVASRIREPGRAAQRGSEGWAGVLGRRDVRLQAVAVAACGVGFGAAMTFHQPFALALGMTQVSTFFVGYTVAATCVRLGLGGLVDRTGAHGVSIASLAVYAGVVATLAALDSVGLWVVGCGLGAAHGAFFPAISTLSMQGAGVAERGRTMGLIYTAFNGGLATSMLSLGWVAERWGYEALFLTAAVVVAGGAWALVRSRGGAVVGATGGMPAGIVRADR
jgi:MFS family permease